MLLFLVALTVTLAFAASALTLRLFGLIASAKVAVAVTAFCAVLTVATVALGEYRYQQCVDRVDRSCRDNACPSSYNGPFIPDCKERRVL